MAKQKLYIVPRYIAPLKYFEKLVPHLSNHFDVSFLLLEDLGMVRYLKERHLSGIETLLPREGDRIPFIAHILDYIHFKKSIQVLLATNPPDVILTEPSITQPMRAVFAAARQQGIPVRALQWCQQSKEYKHLRLSLKNKIRQLRARHGSVLKGIVRELYFTTLATMFRGLTLLGIVEAHYKDREVDELGVIDEYGSEYYRDAGWDGAAMTRVGFYDWSVIADMRRRVKEDPRFRNTLLKKYNLTEGRKRVLILSTIFYAGHATLSMSVREQVEYFARICDDVCDVYGDADILFKLHPRDREVYGPLEASGVRLLRTEANVEELIALSDLYIAHPLTTANFPVLASGIAALFINFTPLTFLDAGKELYGLTMIIKDRDTFREALKEAREGTLPRFYDASRADPESLSHIKRYIEEGGQRMR